MIPCDTLKLIQATAQEAQSAKVLTELNTDGRSAHIQIGNELREVDLPPPPRSHVVYSLVDLMEYAKQPTNAAPVVWHSDQGVVLIIDDADRHDRVIFPLSKSERFLLLSKLAKEMTPFSQAQFIRILRVGLGLDNLTIVSKFRKLQWQSGADSEGNLQHGNDKVGKTVVSKVQAVDELPDEIKIEVPVYQQAGERQEYICRCAIEIDTVNQMFQLIPMPDELERIQDLAQASIEERLGEITATIPVYYGKP